MVRKLDDMCMYIRLDTIPQRDWPTDRRREMVYHYRVVHASTC